VGAFYLLAFGISWLGWAPLVAGSHGVIFFQQRIFQVMLALPGFGPAVAAVIVTRIVDGKDAPRKLLARLLHGRVGLRWYLVALLGPLAILLAAAGIHYLAGGAYPAAGTSLGYGVGPILRVAIAELSISLAANPWEEVGWRGFALERLRRSHNDLISTLVVGALWGLWHTPLFLMGDGTMTGNPFLVWQVGVAAEAFIYTWMYNHTGGSLLTASLFHITLNTLGAVISSFETWAHTLVVCAIAATVVAVYGPGRFRRTNGEQKPPN
jgi:membrane protease YdiL (CAAX protease family)